MGLDFSNYKAPNFDREMISNLKEGLIIFNGIKALTLMDGKKLERDFKNNPDCIYHHEVKTENGSICSHKIRWEKVKQAIDYINGGNHKKYKKAQLWKDMRGISLYLSTDGVNLTDVVYVDNEKVIHEPCILEMFDDDYKEHVSLSIGDIRVYKIY